MSIVIVEDSKPMRNLIKRSLKKADFGDQPIREAGNGIDALRLIREEQPDVVLTDWNMPQMNGIELLKELRKQGCDVTVGFVTSEQSDEMRDEAIREGASFLIGKPFTPEAFNTNLAKHLKGEEAHGAGIPIRRWLEHMLTSMKDVSANPLGYTSGSDVVSFGDVIPDGYKGAYLPFEGGDDLLWMCIFADAAAGQSVARGLFAMGPDEEDLSDEDVVDALGEIVNVISGLVKAMIRAENDDITLSIGLPHSMQSPDEVNCRADKSVAEVRVGPVSVYLSAVKVQ